MVEHVTVVYVSKRIPTEFGIPPYARLPPAVPSCCGSFVCRVMVMPSAQHTVPTPNWIVTAQVKASTTTGTGHHVADTMPVVAAAAFVRVIGIPPAVVRG